MKKLLVLILLCPLVSAKEYVFSCAIDNQESVVSFLVNTKKKYVIFGNGAKYNDNWDETESTIEVQNVIKQGGVQTVFFNKITGRLQQSYRSDYTGKIDMYNYTCSATQRLMP